MGVSMTNFDDVSQVCLFVMSVAVMILVARKNKWGLVFGLTAQPFWLYTACINDQEGIFIKSIMHTLDRCLCICPSQQKINKPINQKKYDITQLLIAEFKAPFFCPKQKINV